VLAAGLALLTSICYGVSNFVGPALSRDLPFYSVLIAGQFVAFCVSGVLVAAGDVPLPETTELAAAGAAGLGNAWGLIAFYRAAAVGPLSVITPIGSLAASVPVAAGVAAGEALGVVKGAGLVLALGGVALVARRQGGPPTGGGDRRAAVAWALSSTLGFGLFLTFMAPASEGGVLWAVMLSRGGLLVALAVVVWTSRAPLRAPLRTLPRLAVPGVLLFAGTLAYSAATREGDLSVVSVLGCLFPLVTVGLAFAFLGERLSRSQLLGAAGALIGSVLLSLRG